MSSQFEPASPLEREKERERGEKKARERCER